MNNIMAWEKWDEGDFFSEELSDEEINDFEKNSDLEGINFNAFPIVFPKVRTPLGFVSIDDPLRPALMFDCWIGHTNFGITEEVKRIIESTPGVEVLKIMTPYRFFIGVGKLFKFRDVREHIQSSLNVKTEDKENSEDINLLTIIKRQLKSYKRWAIFYSKEGTIEYAASNEDNDVEFETTVQKFTEDKNFTVIKSEDEE